MRVKVSYLCLGTSQKLSIVYNIVPSLLNLDFRASEEYHFMRVLYLTIFIAYLNFAHGFLFIV